MMNAKEFLSRIERMSRRIDAMLETAEGYFEKSRRNGAMDDRTVNIFINLGAQLQHEAVDLAENVEKARKVIKLLDSEDEKLFVELRYFRGLKISSIVGEMRCSRATVYNIQQSAVRHVQDILDAGLVSIDG